MAAPRSVEFKITARDRTRRAFRSIARGLRTLGRLATQIARNITLLATTGFGLLARNALTAGSNLKDMADQFGVTTDFLQAFRAAIVEGGASIRQADTFIEKFTTALGEAKAGTEAYREAFLRAGFSSAEIEKLTPTEALDKFLQVAAKADQAGRQALTRPFGERAGVRAVNALLAQQLDTVEKIQQFGGTFGLVPRSTLDRLDAIGTKFAQAFGHVRPALWRLVADVLEKFIDKLPGWLDAFVGLVGALERLFNRIFAGVRAIQQRLGPSEVLPGGRSARVESRIAANRAANQFVHVNDPAMAVWIKIERNTRTGSGYVE